VITLLPVKFRLFNSRCRSGKRSQTSVLWLPFPKDGTSGKRSGCYLPIGRLALRLAKAEALPDWSIVVETCACRMSFCCTPTGAPVSSSHARYV
jgi:hypothetical protein